MMFPKYRYVKLHGKAKRALREAIFKRDDYKCIICRKPAKEWHHEKRVPGLRNDVIEEGVALCHNCHQQRTDHDWGGSLKKQIREYLNKLYGTFEK